MSRSSTHSKPLRLAVFLATSGHSGVDRIMGMLLPSIASRGVKVDLLHVNGKGPYIRSDGENLRVVELGSSHSFTSLKPLVHYLKRERPDALLSDKDRVNQIAIAAKWLSGGSTRIVLRSGTTITKALEERGLAARITHYLSMKYLYKYADAITTPSAGSAKDLSGFAHIPSGKITVIPNPVNTRMIKLLASEPVTHEWFGPGQPPVVAAIGELGGSKDYDTLLRAFAILRSERPARLFIMGEGKGRARLQGLLAELHLEQDVELFGFTSNPFAFLARSSLFVLSSRYEGFGMVLLEALTLGVPSVSTDCPFGPRDILENGKFGALVPVGDSAAMAAQMARTLDDPPGPAYLMEAALPYGLELITDRYLDITGLKDHKQVRTEKDAQ